MLKTIGFVSLGATLALGATDYAAQLSTQLSTLLNIRREFKAGTTDQYAPYYLAALDVPFKNYIDVPSFDDWTREDLKNMTQLYVDYRNKGLEYVIAADLIGMQSIENTTSSSSNSTGLEFTPLGEELQFNDIWKDSYDSETVSRIKSDLKDNGGTILYEVEAFYDYMYGPEGVFTQFYTTFGRGQAVDPEKEVPDRYQDYFRYIFSVNDNVLVVTSWQASYLLITQKAAQLISEDTNENVDVPDGDQIFSDNIMELIEFNDGLSSNSTQSQ